MKKLYVSCPVEGRELMDILDTIKRMHRIAEAIFGEELDVIDNIRVEELTGTDLENLSRRIKLIAEADYFIDVFDYSDRTVYLETEIAEGYNIKTVNVAAKHVMNEIGDRNE